MKKMIILLIVCISLTTGKLTAQTPTYSYSITTGNSIFPFAPTLYSPYNKTQVFYRPSNFPAIPGGNMTDIYFRINNSGPVTYTNFSVSMGVTTLSGFQWSSPWVTGLTNVFFASSFSVPASAEGTWIKIPLQTQFQWDGISNFIVEAFHEGYSGTPMRLLIKSSNDIQRYGNVNDGAPSAGDTDKPNFGFDICLASALSGPTLMCPGSSATFSANFPGGTWSSSDNSVLTVNPSTGVATAVGIGNASLSYVTSVNCGAVTSYKSVIVNPPASAGNISGPSSACPQTTIQYTTDGTAGGTWSSSNPNAAWVTTAGEVHTLFPGTTNISYKVIDCNGTQLVSSKTLTVNQYSTVGNYFTGGPTFCIGQTGQYTSNGTPGGTWSISNTSIATTTPSGLVTALSPGTTNMYYTVTTGCGSPMTSNPVPVYVLPNVSVGTIVGLSPLNIGETAQYTINGGSWGTWSSSNESVATVDPYDGIVYAVNHGTTNIIYTVDGCGGPVSTFKTLTVGPVHCGLNNEKYIVCHNGNEICIAESAVPAHLAHGDNLGSCPPQSRGSNEISEMKSRSVYVYPNPASNHVIIQNNDNKTLGTVRIYDASGKVVYQKFIGNKQTVIDVKSFSSGIYYLRTDQSATAIKFVKQ